MKKVILAFSIHVMLISGCAMMSEDIGNFQQRVGLSTNVREFQGYRFEAISCELRASRAATCKMLVTSKFQNRYIRFRKVSLQDDTGKTYPARAVFGDDPGSGSNRSTLIADTPYPVTLSVDNLDSRATKIRAILVEGIYRAGSVKMAPNIALTNPPMVEPPVHTSNQE